jgi:DNA-binding FadR family transcriptional regulator
MSEDQLPMSTRRVADRLGARLAAMILEGDLPSGAWLPTERELMQRFGVSRTAVREAITGLAGRGLLLTRPGCRPVVRQPSYEAALDAIGDLVGHLTRDAEGAKTLFDSRVLLEAALARHAAEHARKDDIAELRDALERNRAAIGDPRAFYDTDVAFHGILFRIPRNPIYPAVHKAYVAWLMRHWAAMDRTAEIDRLNHAGHATLFEAILARDPDAAEAALRDHLRFAWKLVRVTFEPGSAERPAEPIEDHAPGGALEPDGRRH